MSGRVLTVGQRDALALVDAGRVRVTDDALEWRIDGNRPHRGLSAILNRLWLDLHLIEPGQDRIVRRVAAPSPGDGSDG